MGWQFVDPVHRRRERQEGGVGGRAPPPRRHTRLWGAAATAGEAPRLDEARGDGVRVVGAERDGDIEGDVREAEGGERGGELLRGYDVARARAREEERLGAQDGRVRRGEHAGVGHLLDGVARVVEEARAKLSDSRDVGGAGHVEDHVDLREAELDAVAARVEHAIVEGEATDEQALLGAQHLLHRAQVSVAAVGQRREDVRRRVDIGHLAVVDGIIDHRLLHHEGPRPRRGGTAHQAGDAPLGVGVIVDDATLAARDVRQPPEGVDVLVHRLERDEHLVLAGGGHRGREGLPHQRAELGALRALHAVGGEGASPGEEGRVVVRVVVSSRADHAALLHESRDELGDGRSDLVSLRDAEAAAVWVVLRVGHKVVLHVDDEQRVVGADGRRGEGVGQSVAHRFDEFGEERRVGGAPLRLGLEGAVLLECLVVQLAIERGPADGSRGPRRGILPNLAGRRGIKGRRRLPN
mmetsp:Transcript_65750/g.173579  ORF Transcript_65750/g.173579 Transcript_65750/m.173579 type:complete len:467 (+) Transcript_65750:363-1763(+)